ncbi:hypothetical protein GE061_014286 [Apolygus lucorum]|uniref:Uncharacterized protein n=1 Tax=Apolygus lucorum TaxID=248454 RepID=A0A8S9XS84_APOLU|nr:hypothetical protein GE061_014286 [Apolygus lucorum]
MPHNGTFSWIDKHQHYQLDRILKLEDSCYHLAFEDREALYSCRSTVVQCPDVKDDAQTRRADSELRTDRQLTARRNLTAIPRSKIKDSTLDLPTARSITDRLRDLTPSRLPLEEAYCLFFRGRKRVIFTEELRIWNS